MKLVFTSHGLPPPPVERWKAPGRFSWESFAYIAPTMPHWRKFEVQFVTLERNFAFESAGNSIAARMAMIAMTTSSSISVKAPERVFDLLDERIDLAPRFST